MVLKNKGEGRWMKHLDLFSGIGGFALAADRVWENVEHTFCEIDPFCQEVLKKHWPKSKIYDDIRTLTTNTKHDGQLRTEEVGTDSGTQPEGSTRQELSEPELEGVSSLRTSEARWDLLTGGFPCQPFSQAGRKRGTEDDRYLWPEMLRVIKEFKPTWIIGENVAGIVNMVLEQVCLDLETEGYEVQPVIIPAVSVNAPHRRDRVWIVANRISSRSRGDNAQVSDERRSTGEDRTTSVQPQDRQAFPNNTQQSDSDNWNQNWLEVATELCRVDDGVPKRLDRNPRLKALGNAIVPQVAEEIMRAISIN